MAPFRFNPLDPPPGTQRDIWIKKLVEILAHVYGFRGATSYLLQRTLYELCRTHQGFTFDDVRQYLEHLKPLGREGQWLQSARRVIGTLCFGPVANVLNGDPTPVQNLLECPVIFELDALTDADKTFIIEALLLWVHQYRLQQPVRERFRHAILIEEAHHVLLKHRQTKETVMDVVLREIRELGESVILIDQHPSLISLPSLGNTYCTIAMNVKHGSDVAALGSALQLDSETRDCLGRLPVGSGIVRLQGRWSYPFLVRFPQCDVAKGSTNDSALEANPSHSAPASVIRAAEETTGEIRAVRFSDERAQCERDANRKPELRCGLLADIADYLMCGVAERYKRLGVSAEAGTNLKEEVLSRGWAKQGGVRVGKRSLTVLTLTTAGLKLLQESGWQGEVATPDDHAGAEHEFWKAWLFSELRKRGIEVEAEKSLANGHRVDLLVHNYQRQIAIEIETGKSDIQRNLRAAFEAGMRRCIVVTVKKGTDAQVAGQDAVSAGVAVAVDWVPAGDLAVNSDDLRRFIATLASDGSAGVP